MKEPLEIQTICYEIDRMLKCWRILHCMLYHLIAFIPVKEGLGLKGG